MYSDEEPMLNPSVRLKFVSSYSDSALAAAVRSLLRIDAGIVRLLADTSPRRLVVVKPNWIQEAHEYRPDVWEPVITHPTVILAVVEGLADMMGGQGTIVVCDAPHTYANFESIVTRGHLRQKFESLRGRFPDLSLELLDLRREVWIRREEVVVERRPNTPDPRGYVRLDLGTESLFYRHRGEGRYYGADYDLCEVNSHHRGTVHEYLLAGTPMKCDLFVNLPKLKTHKKTGLTCCLKNLVGINGDKNWLPHHTEGGPQDGGDEFPTESFATRLERRLKRMGRRMALTVPGLGTFAFRKMRNAGKRFLGDSEKVVRNGNWHGNDTCWRMALDLNRALLYGNPDGTWRQAGQPRHYLAVVDGIIGGEGNGPLCPDAVASGVLFAGNNPAVVDAVACRLMGFDPRLFPIVMGAFAPHRWPIARGRLEDVTAEQPDGTCVQLAELTAAVPGGFRPHFGWTSFVSAKG